jgi:hypothetical protein
MSSSVMLRLVPLVRNDVTEDRIASIFRVMRFGELGTTPDDGGSTFLRNVGYYKSHTA